MLGVYKSIHIMKETINQNGGEAMISK